MKTRFFIVAAALTVVAVFFAFHSYAKKPDGGSIIPATETINAASDSLEPTYVSNKPSSTDKPTFEIRRPVRIMEPLPICHRCGEGSKPNRTGFDPNEPVSLKKSK